MAKKNCCIEPADLRVLTLDQAGPGMHVVYTVPTDKVFVVTAWMMSVPNQASVSTRMLRSGSRVALNRIFDPIKQFNHIIFPTGIAFAAGQTIELDDFFNWADHTLYGYELDD